MADIRRVLSALKAIPEVTVGRAFHYGLCSRKFDGRCTNLCDVIVKITNQECAKLRFAKRLEELRETTSLDVVIASVIVVST